MPNARKPGNSRISSVCSIPSLLSTDGMMSVPAALCASNALNCAVVEAALGHEARDVGPAVPARSCVHCPTRLVLRIHVDLDAVAADGDRPRDARGDARVVAAVPRVVLDAREHRHVRALGRAHHVRELRPADGSEHLVGVDEIEADVAEDLDELGANTQIARTDPLARARPMPSSRPAASTFEAIYFTFWRTQRFEQRQRSLSLFFSSIIMCPLPLRPSSCSLMNVFPDAGLLRYPRGAVVVGRVIRGFAHRIRIGEPLQAAEACAPAPCIQHRTRSGAVGGLLFRAGYCGGLGSAAARR